MKKTGLIAVGILLALSCNKDDNRSSGDVNYREEMRAFVIGISEYSKAINTKFQIIPQNGIELVSSNGNEDGEPHTAYLNAIDGNGQEDLFYGYNNDDQVTPNDENTYLKAFLDLSRHAGKTILVTDYCSTPAKMSDSYAKNKNAGYVSFAADHRELDNIPNYPSPIYAENNGTITALPQVRNFLYIINPEGFATKSDLINAVTSTNYDLVIMDLFFNDGVVFTASELGQLKNKANGGKRLVIAYMSIGEAEDYRYYWQSSWNTNRPAWMDAENPDWEGNFKVEYWNKEWQSIIFGNDGSYLKKIIDAGFDGVYLDIIDAYEYFE